MTLSAMHFAGKIYVGQGEIRSGSETTNGPTETFREDTEVTERK